MKGRDALRRRLMEHRIYCAVHWPFDGVQADERPLARKLAAQMLSLPIDQIHPSPFQARKSFDEQELTF